ncbi:methylase, partial [Rhizobium leguminosarum]|nr:methylase [Rhizobium ruizarguesonis]
MNIISHPQIVSTSPRPDIKTGAKALIDAAGRIASLLEQGKVLTTADLRQIMTEVFGGSDAEGVWLWKEAYEATEIAQVLFLRKFRTIVSRSQSPQATLAMLTKVANLTPTHTRRSEESQALQQFSTPIPLAYVASRAASITAADVVLEPSAGTGMMAIFAELAGARLALNEYAVVRHSLLGRLFAGVSASRHDAAHIDDYLDRSIRPTVVLMNPPFSAGVHVEGRVADAAWRHLSSAFARLAPGGRLVAITGASFSPDNPAWRGAFVRLQEKGTVLFTAGVDGGIYARHGTTMETRLIVIDKIPADNPSQLVTTSGTAHDLETLLTWITGFAPRAPAAASNSIGALSNGSLRADTMRPAAVAAPTHRPAVGEQAQPAATVRPIPVDDEIIELSYELRDARPKD